MKFQEKEEKKKEKKKFYPSEEEKEGKECPNCGAINELEAKFCEECGYNFEGLKVCPYCGKKIEDYHTGNKYASNETNFRFSI